MALPQFWVGLVLIGIFFVNLHLLPGPVGACRSVSPCRRASPASCCIDTLLAGEPGAVVAGGASNSPCRRSRSGFSTAAPIARVTRSAMVEAHAERLHPHGDRHGPRPAGRVVPLQPAQRAAAGGDPDRRYRRPHLRGRGAARIDLRLAGARAVRPAGHRTLRTSPPCRASSSTPRCSTCWPSWRSISSTCSSIRGCGMSPRDAVGEISPELGAHPPGAAPAESFPGRCGSAPAS